jgi:eight-cysteine-cluster-containing protein
MNTSSKLLAVILLGAVMLISGCISGLDAESLAKANPIVQDFLRDHPGAEILVTHFTENQSGMMLGEIREECANPYIEAKDFYRVRFTDDETSFYAAVWIDWDARKVECAFKKGEGSDVIENCTSHAVAKCYGQHVYWFDSCGYKEEKKEQCEQGCEEGACVGEQTQCRSHHEYRCYGDHVYWYDSCGSKEEEKQECEHGCQDGACIVEENRCEAEGGYCQSPADSSACREGYGFDHEIECPDNGTCCMPAPVEESACEDTDRGLNIYERGIAYEEGGAQYGDTCYTVKSLKEFYCEESKVSYKKVDCPAGFKCVTGECRVSGGGFCGTSTKGECGSDSGCVAGGCSGQVCQSSQENQTATTCEWMDCYDSSQYGLECTCNYNECMWTSSGA